MSKVSLRLGTVAPRSPAPPDGNSRTHGTLVRTAVVLTVVLVVGMMSLIYLRWIKVREPTTAIQVNGDPSLDGTVVVVEPLLPATNSKSITVTLGESNGFQTPIFRYPGQYHVTATVPWLRQPLYHADIILDQLRVWNINLPTVLTIIGDSSFDGDMVMVSVVVAGGQGRDVAAGMLVKADDFRLLIPVVPGQYSITATRNGATISEQKVTILLHTAKQIDLRKKS